MAHDRWAAPSWPLPQDLQPRSQTAREVVLATMAARTGVARGSTHAAISHSPYDPPCSLLHWH
ncbi:hypothetical protein E2562_019882 [Oryza meyeriana var. granulata]|uniref:Uncharacterized protein n=1 Tax=Oryza meyeriana var. granulata TaxID=110450 RepID=A0A6G1EXI5_9ORYZ|nr:hypothetical protein E2562_019882 [Oryza meyeriana var. granulata]